MMNIMEKKRILYVFQEVYPYMDESEISLVGRHLPQKIQENGSDIRIFTPRFGIINERRNQLHEVIRLSRMNLIIDDFDHQLIIKVASIQRSRIQVYFIDNDEYFPKQCCVRNEEEKFMPNNDERMMFFCKGVIETVKKLGWSPDIIHCHGWFTSLVPLYIKTLYQDDPLFSNSKIVYSAYETGFNEKLNPKLAEKLMFDNKIKDADIHQIKTPDFNSINQLAIDYSDAIVCGSANLNQEVEDHIRSANKPILDYVDAENEEYAKLCSDFYDEIFQQEEDEIAINS